MNEWMQEVYNKSIQLNSLYEVFSDFFASIHYSWQVVDLGLQVLLFLHLLLTLRAEGGLEVGVYLFESFTEGWPSVKSICYYFDGVVLDLLASYFGWTLTDFPLYFVQTMEDCLLEYFSPVRMGLLDEAAPGLMRRNELKSIG